MFVNRIIVKQDQQMDYLLIVLSGTVQLFKFSCIDHHRSLSSIMCYIDHPYGILSSGSSYGATNLLSPQLSTCSLFTTSSGFYLSLSQSDYMSILSLVWFIVDFEYREMKSASLLLIWLNTFLPWTTTLPQNHYLIPYLILTRKYLQRFSLSNHLLFSSSTLKDLNLFMNLFPFPLSTLLFLSSPSYLLWIQHLQKCTAFLNHWRKQSHWMVYLYILQRRTLITENSFFLLISLTIRTLVV